MSIVDKIKKSVEDATGRPFIYDTLEGLNVEIGRRSTARVVWSALVDSGTIEDENGMIHERVNMALFFCDKMAGLDCFSLENERVLTECKRAAFTWLTQSRRDPEIRVVSVNATARTYQQLDDIITAFVLDVVIEEKEGFGVCDLPRPMRK